MLGTFWAQDVKVVIQRGLYRVDFLIGKSRRIFLIWHTIMIKFGDFEFMFAFRDLKLPWRSEEHKLKMAHNRGLFFTINLPNSKSTLKDLFCMTTLTSCLLGLITMHSHVDIVLCICIQVEGELIQSL